MRVIIVSGSEKNGDFLRDSLRSYGFTVECENNAAAVRRRLSGFECDIAIIDSPLPGEFGNDLAADIAESTYAAVILTVKNDMLERAVYSMRQAGVLVIGKPLPREVLIQTVNIAASVRARLRQAEKKTVSLYEKLEELKCISRAKLLLMQKLSISEDDAHHHIEKLAMDTRTGKKAAALNIIKEYES